MVSGEGLVMVNSIILFPFRFDGSIVPDLEDLASTLGILDQSGQPFAFGIPRSRRPTPLVPRFHLDPLEAGQVLSAARGFLALYTVTNTPSALVY